MTAADASRAPGAKPCRVLLVGMMGSGKSTVGRRLSEATGWPYLDNDELLRRRTGSTARELLATRGEAAMREAEADALALGAELPPPVIVGVAAGTIEDETNRRLLAGGGVVVWLRASTDVLARRASQAAHRPFVDRTEAEAWLAETGKDRAPMYGQVADLTIDTGAMDPDETVEVIRRHLDRIGCER